MITSKVRRFSVALVALTAALAGSAPARAEGEKVDLKPKFTPGNELKYVLDVTTDSAQTMGAMGEMKQSINQSMTVSSKIVSADENGAVADITVKRIKLKAESPMGGGEFDSDSPADQDGQNPMAQLRQLVGKTFSFQLALDGEIKDVKIPEDLGPMMKAGAEAMKSQFAALFRVKKGDPLTAVGDTWKQSEEQPMGRLGNLHAEGEYKLESVKEAVASITLANKLTYKEGAAPEGMEIKDGTTKGDYEWNSKDGTLNNCKIEQVIQIAGKMNDTDMTANLKNITTLKRAE